MPGERKIYSDIVLFGVRVIFEWDQQPFIETALSSYSDWVDPHYRCGSAAVHVLLTTRDMKEHAACGHRLDGGRLSATRSGIFLHADGTRAHGVCVFPSRGVLPEEIKDAIDTVVLFLVAQADRTPIHASALMLEDKAFVMAGKSGSGKSSLAYAAQKAGLPILSEDTVFVQTTPCFRLWGWPRAIHLLESDAPKGANGSMRLRAERVKFALPIAHSRRWADKASLCLIEPGHKVALEAIEEEEALSALTRAPEPGYDFYGPRAAAAIRAVAAGGCWRLTLSPDPVAAVATLVDAFAESSSRCLS